MKYKKYTPGGMKGLDSSKGKPSGNPFPSEVNGEANVCWSSEHAKESRCKSIVVHIYNRVGKPKTLRK